MSHRRKRFLQLQSKSWARPSPLNAHHLDGCKGVFRESYVSETTSSPHSQSRSAPRCNGDLSYDEPSCPTCFLKNLLTDISGVRVGHADDAALASGFTAVTFDQPAASAPPVR